MATDIKLPTSVSNAANRLLDWTLGEILDNPRVTKAVSWMMVAGGALFHGSLGTELSAVLISAGGLAHVVHSTKA